MSHITNKPLRAAGRGAFSCLFCYDICRLQNSIRRTTFDGSMFLWQNKNTKQFLVSSSLYELYSASVQLSITVHAPQSVTHTHARTPEHAELMTEWNGVCARANFRCDSHVSHFVAVEFLMHTALTHRGCVLKSSLMCVTSSRANLQKRARLVVVRTIFTVHNRVCVTRVSNSLFVFTSIVIETGFELFLLSLSRSHARTPPAKCRYVHGISVGGVRSHSVMAETQRSRAKWNIRMACDIVRCRFVDFHAHAH